MKFVKRLFLAVGFVGLFYPVLTVYVPLSEFSDVGGILYYLVGTALVTLLLPFWFTWIPFQIGLVIVCYRYYLPSDLSGMAWFQNEISQVGASLAQFFTGASAIFPTNVSLVMMLSLIALSGYLLIVHLRPVAGIMAAMIYVMILQVFTKYDYFAAMVQILGMGLFVLGVSGISTTVGWKKALGSLLIVTGMSAGLTRVAVWATESLVSQQQWVENQAKNVNRSLDEAGLFDLVDYYNSGGSLTRMGYDEDDSQLGGPVQQNFDPAFAAYDDEPHYWRISTRSVYTGVGWENPDTLNLLPVEYGFVESTGEEETVEITIDREGDFPYFPYTYQMVGANIEGGAFEYVVPSNELYVDNVGGVVPYSLTLVDLEIDFAGLNSVSIENELGLEEYLVVPESVPQRVWDLAAELTAGPGTMYEKVRALEQYLSSDGGFRYSLREASVLPDGADYVDHFLFESGVGYCDNFSTAMVVMARMAGIPARWAKGFNSGTAAVDADGVAYYEVTNANAHSWPEIYFPEHGWVPFEPTPAFNQPLTSVASNEDAVLPDEDDVLNPDEVSKEPEMPVSESSSREVPESTEVGEEARATEERYLPELVGVLLLAGIIAVYWWRHKLYPLAAEWLLRLPRMDKRRVILWLFDLEQPRASAQTLRQYFGEIERLAPMHRAVIERFVALNEATLYGPDETIIVDDQIYEDMIAVYRDIQKMKEKSSF
ncbi:DUF4129 domain-containing transglutaminase family protein [Jeotgalibaca sp. A127]|uniref:DUF4129 domain-containing transglutaminase family protein n=1 Tax=Jeotgalibaca sp. A127 TaxID=3457324 RepID=UPI003FD5F9C9